MIFEVKQFVFKILRIFLEIRRSIHILFAAIYIYNDASSDFALSNITLQRS